MYWKKALYWNGLQNHLLFPYAEQLRAHQMKMNWAEGSFSDPITILNAYQVWKEHCHSDYFRRSGQTEHEREAQWARKSFVQLRALKVSWCKFRIPHSMSSVACVYFFIGNGLPGRWNKSASQVTGYRAALGSQHPPADSYAEGTAFARGRVRRLLPTLFLPRCCNGSDRWARGCEIIMRNGPVHHSATWRIPNQSAWKGIYSADKRKHVWDFQ